MEIILIRHTQPDIANGICYGATDVPLIATYADDHDNVIRLLGDTTGYNVYSSPSIRCLSLAKLIYHSPIVTPMLKELNFGDWEMKPWANINDDFAQKWYTDFVSTVCPNGESFEMLYARCIEFWKTTVLPTQTDSIIVTHSGFIRASLAYFKGISLKASFETNVPFGSITRISA